jgi:hypothetical protein
MDNEEERSLEDKALAIVQEILSALKNMSRDNENACGVFSLLEVVIIRHP